MHAENRINTIKKNNYKFNFERIAFVFILLDIAILPVSPIYSVPISFFIAFFYAMKYYNIKTFDRIFAMIIFVSSLILSTLLSFINKESMAIISNDITTTLISVQKEDLKRLIYILIGILIYKATYALHKKYNIITFDSIKKVLLAVCLIFLFLGIIFEMDISLFYRIKGIFFNADVNMTTNDVLKSAGYLSRYNFILLDPNNACYFILMVVIFLLENYNLNTIEKIFVWIVMLIALFFTKSLGGVYTVLIYIFLKSLFYFKMRINFKRLIVHYSIFLILILIIFIDAYSSNHLMNSIVESEAFQRWSINSLNGRSTIYLEFLKDLPPLIGNGYILIRNGNYISPHSDHLRFLYSYGVLSYLSLLMIIFNRRFLSHRYLFTIPAIIAFSINSLIDETRLLYTFIILLSILNSETSIKEA